MPLRAREGGVEDVPAIELGNRQQVQHRDVHPQPTSDGHRVERDRAAGVREVPEQQRHSRVPEYHPPPERNLHARHARLRWHNLAMRESKPKHGERDDEARDRSCGADVEELSAVVENRAEPNEGAECPDPDGCRRSGNEERRRHIYLIATRREIMTHLVTKEDAEEWQRERKPGHPASKKSEVPGGRIVEHAEIGGQPARDHGAGHRRQEQRRREQQPVQQPRFPRLDGGARQYEMAPVPLVGPVVSPWPLAQGIRERHGGFGVSRIYKSVNNFAVVEGGGRPRQQKPCEGHCRVLYLSVRTPPKSQVSIFNQDQSPSRGSPRRSAKRS